MRWNRTVRYAGGKLERERFLRYVYKLKEAGVIRKAGITNLYDVATNMRKQYADADEHTWYYGNVTADIGVYWKQPPNSEWDMFGPLD